jgi:hypothetical protein
MKNINNLSLGNLQWLRDKAIPVSKLRITPEHLDIVMRARALVLGFDFNPAGCFSCSARSEFMVGKAVLEQYESEILSRIVELEALENLTPAPEITYYNDQGEVITNITQDLTNFVDNELDVQVEVKKPKKNGQTK